MKKKIMISMLGVLVLSLTIVSSLFMIIINYQYVENAKKELKNTNYMFINIYKEQKGDIKKFSSFSKKLLKESDIRITLVDKKGKVLSDSKNDISKLDNHNKRDEVIDARQKGQGYSIRHSASIYSDSLYYATKFDDSYIIRTSMKMKQVSFSEGEYFKYYIYIIIFSLVVSILFSSRLSHAIVEPIKYLNFITSRMAKGELDRRVTITSDDEIGELGKTFNNMSDKLENTLREVIDKQNRLEAILKSMDSGVIAIDKEFKVIMINPYAKKLFGIKGDVIGENLMDKIRDFEFENIFRNDDIDNKEINILWPNKRDLRVKTADIVSKYDLIGKVAVVQDVTDIKRLEKMREQFVANVSHELKTPLTSIKGFAETLKYVENKDTREKFLKIINDEAERLTRLIQDILVLSNIEKNKNTEEMQTFNINDLIEDVLYLVKKSADNKSISIFLNKDDLPNIKGYKDKYKQLVINLIDNAIKYTEPEGRVIVTTNLDNTSNNIVLVVEDTGVGIPKKYLDRIFERFYRIDKARSRSEGGTGLGLAIVKHIVISINGKIEVQSEPNKGSKFIIRIPIYQ
ncbi:two-component system histidine kinase PnpS [Clostridium oceanicum]|uniref:histidine kinase n=1 Tax=Clostridium oceanicum TaxID=1543 RepID=A0ABP3UHS0_9CLOT